MIRVGTALHSKMVNKCHCVIAVALMATCLILMSACGSMENDAPGISSNNTPAYTAKTSPAVTSEPPTETSDLPTDTSDPSDISAEGTELFQDIPRIPESKREYSYFINTVDIEDIFPKITSNSILWREALEAMSRDQLQLLRNEIYARHGFVFQSKALNDYFSKKSWYKPNPSIRHPACIQQVS